MADRWVAFKLILRESFSLTCSSSLILFLEFQTTTTTRIYDLLPAPWIALALLFSCSPGSLPPLHAATDSLKVEVLLLSALTYAPFNSHQHTWRTDGHTWFKRVKKITWPSPACRTKGFLTGFLWFASNLKLKRTPKSPTYGFKILTCWPGSWLSSLSSTPFWWDSCLVGLVVLHPTARFLTAEMNSFTELMK